MDDLEFDGIDQVLRVMENAQAEDWPEEQLLARLTEIMLTALEVSFINDCIRGASEQPRSEDRLS